MDETTKNEIKTHIESLLAFYEKILDGLTAGKDVKAILDKTGEPVEIISNEENIRKFSLNVGAYRELKADFDAGNFDTDLMIILQDMIKPAIPQKRTIRQNKRTNQLHLSILTPTEIIDRKNSISQPIQLAGTPGAGIIYDGFTELTRQVRGDIVRFMDLWTSHYHENKTAEFKAKTTDMMQEWDLSSYPSFRSRLKTVAAAMTSIKAETKGGGYVVLFPAVFIEQNTGYFIIRADQTLCRELDGGSSALPLALEYWKFNLNDNPYAPEILHKLSVQDQMNKKNSRRNVMHWKTLVRCLKHFPQEQDVRKTQSRHYKERMFDPLMRDMAELKNRRLIDWNHINADPQNWQELMQGKFEWNIL